MVRRPALRPGKAACELVGRLRGPRPGAGARAHIHVGLPHVEAAAPRQRVPAPRGRKPSPAGPSGVQYLGEVPRGRPGALPRRAAPRAPVASVGGRRGCWGGGAPSAAAPPDHYATELQGSGRGHHGRSQGHWPPSGQPGAPQWRPGRLHRHRHPHHPRSPHSSHHHQCRGASSAQIARRREGSQSPQCRSAHKSLSAHSSSFLLLCSYSSSPSSSASSSLLPTCPPI